MNKADFPPTLGDDDNAELVAEDFDANVVATLDGIIVAEGRMVNGRCFLAIQGVQLTADAHELRVSCPATGHWTSLSFVVVKNRRQLFAGAWDEAPLTAHEDDDDDSDQSDEEEDEEEGEGEGDDADSFIESDGSSDSDDEYVPE